MRAQHAPARRTLVAQRGPVVILENARLRIELDADEPRVVRYVDLATGAFLLGDPFENSAFAAVLEGVSTQPTSLVVDTVTANAAEVSYALTATTSSGATATFRLRFTLRERGVVVGILDVQEQGGLLTDFQIPGLLTVLGSDPQPKMAFPFFQGRLIDLAATAPGVEYVGIRGQIANPLQAVFLMKQGIGGALTWTHFDLLPAVSVRDDAGLGRVAQLGASFRYRILPQDFTLAAIAPAFEPDTMTAEITVFGDHDADGDTDWMDGAKQLRDGIDLSPEPRYADAWMTVYGADFLPRLRDILSGQNWPVTLEKFANFTDHARIVTYLNSASDNPPGARGLYVALFGTSGDFQESFATAADVAFVIEEARRRYNTILSFADNYADLLVGEPGFDLALIKTHENGDPNFGFDFRPDFESFAVDPYDYMVAEGLDRIQRTLDRYPIADTIYQDVLSLLPGLADHSLASPSSFEKQRRGVQLLVDRFAQDGINVSSEGLTEHATRMGMGWFFDGLLLPSRPDADMGFPFDTEEVIPLLQFVLHGKTLYSAAMCCGSTNTVVDNLIMGAGSRATLDHEDISPFYLIELPWHLLNRRLWQEFQQNGTYRKVTYDDDTYVEGDTALDTYKVVVDGRTIAENYSTIYPKSGKAFLIFSRDAQQIEVDLPNNWSLTPADQTLFKLTETGPVGPVPFTLVGTTLRFVAEANTPYKLSDSTFTDDPVVPGVTIVKATHVQEMRDHIDALRVARSLGVYDWTDRMLSVTTSVVAAVHMQELRAALDDVYDFDALVRPTYANAIAPASTILALDITQLRANIVARE